MNTYEEGKKSINNLCDCGSRVKKDFSPITVRDIGFVY